MKDLDLIILSVIAETPRYAHEISQVLDHRGLRNWVTIGVSSLYYVLDQLEEQGFIRVHLPFEQVHSARKHYHITDSGKGVMRTAILERLSDANTSATAFDLAAMLTHLLPRKSVQDALARRRDNLTQHIHQGQRLLNTLPQATDDPRRALYERRLMLLQTDLDWLETFTPKLRSLTEDQASQTQPLDLDKLLAPNRLQKIHRPKQDS